MPRFARPASDGARLDSYASNRGRQDGQELVSQLEWAWLRREGFLGGRVAELTAADQNGPVLTISSAMPAQMRMV